MAAKSMTGVLLAGGMNRRMGGQSKALLKLEGRTFLELQLEELARLCRERILVTNEPGVYQEQLGCFAGDVRIIPDMQPGSGPLAGLQAAMTAAETDVLWVVGCDMPCISSRAAGLLARLRDAADSEAAIARLGGRLHPLHGIYHRRCLPHVESLLAAGEYRLMRLFERIGSQEADETDFEREGIPCDFVKNINVPEDYKRLLEHR